MQTGWSAFDELECRNVKKYFMTQGFIAKYPELIARLAKNGLRVF